MSASEPSSREDLEDPVGLCASCWEAHYKVLRDDSEDWRLRNNRVLLRNGFTNTQELAGDHWPSLPRLLDSARTGCGFCAFLRESILSSRFNDALQHSAERRITKADRQRLVFELRYGTELSPDSLPSRPRGLRSLTVDVTFETGPCLSIYFEIASIGRYQGVVEWLGLTPPALKGYEDETVSCFLKTVLHNSRFFVEDIDDSKEFVAVSLFELGRSSLRLLETESTTATAAGPSSHDNRHNDQNNTKFLPKRLIYVEADILRLVETGSIRASSTAQSEYCALSYCWGPPEDAKVQTKTTSRNIQRHLAKLDFNALSPVLKDAVKTTRSLSIPYLWVDSLCILQDDISDWQNECGQMNKIYGKARVTLIAAASRTCTERFLSPKRHELIFPYKSARRHDITGSFIMRFTHVYGRAEGSFICGMRNDLHNDLTFSQWARRGWTFQEDAMAGPRIVFGSSGVYFAMHNHYVWKNGKAGSTEPKSIEGMQRNDQLHRRWACCMKRYSTFTSTSFTKPTDLLPALSGLARMFGDKLQVKYIAGHWIDRLHFTLLWDYDSGQTHTSLDAIRKLHDELPYLVPSWSCLTRGKIKLLSINSRTEAHFRRRMRKAWSEIVILAVDMSTVGEDPYGAINEACLHLEGLVLDLTSLSWSQSQNGMVASVGTHGEFQFIRGESEPTEPWNGNFIMCSHSCLPEKGDPACHYKVTVDFQPERGQRSQLGKDERFHEQLTSQAKLLLVASEEIFEGDGVKGIWGYGLVLAPLGAPSEPSFIRVGTFSPISYRNTLCCLKGLMKKQKIKLF